MSSRKAGPAREFDILIERLSKAIPTSRVTEDRPQNPAGEHWLDIAVPNLPKMQVSWRPARGFGLYTDEIFADVNALLVAIQNRASGICDVPASDSGRVRATTP